MEPQSGPCISLYAPMKKGAEAEQNALRVHILLREAASILNRRGHHRDAIQQWLEPVEQLLLDRSYWENQERGFAAFLSPHRCRHFALPFEVAAQVRVSPRFHLKPLLPILVPDERFYVLTLSENRLRLFECGPGRCRSLPLPPGMPTNLARSNHEDAGQLESRQRFFSQVSESLVAVLDSQSVLLLLAGVDELVQGFLQELAYPWVLSEHLSGDFDQADPDQLLTQAWALADLHFRSLERRAVAGYLSAPVALVASSDLEQVLRAALDGRIAALFLARGQNVWGEVSQPDRKPQRLPADHPGAYDLLDQAASETLQKGGQVYALEAAAMPDPASPVSAIFRY